MVLLFFLVVGGLMLGLLPATFLMVSVWFAWTPLPLIYRVPIAICLYLPFGLLVASVPLGTAPLFAILFAFLLLGLFVADRSMFFKFYLGFVGVIFAPLLITLWNNREFVEELDYQSMTYCLLVMLLIALFVSPIRFANLLLTRVFTVMDGQELSHLTGRTPNEWIVDIKTRSGDEWTFAQTMTYLEGFGVPADVRSRIVNGLFRMMNKTAPLTPADDGVHGLTMILQKAFSGPAQRNQYSLRQLIGWTIAAAVLFAIIRAQGVSEDWGYAALSALPSIVFASSGAVIVGCAWLIAIVNKWLRYFMHAVAVICFASCALWLPIPRTILPMLPPMTTFFLASVGLGTYCWYSLWMMYLADRGFYLVLANRARNESVSQDSTQCVSMARIETSSLGDAVPYQERTDCDNDVTVSSNGC